jgi:hypothetical protein
MLQIISPFGKMQNESGNGSDHGSNSGRQRESLPDYEPPNIQEAKKFRSTTLPRRLRDPSQPSGFRLAAVGEDKDQFGNEAQLYPVFCTGTNVLNEFGVGVSLYFKTLKALFCLLFICAFISLVRLTNKYILLFSNFLPSSS